MSRLAKNIDGVIVVAHHRVAAPGYTLYTADVVADGHVQDGWNGFVDDIEAEDIAAPWRQPTGAEDAYALGATVEHDGIVWHSNIIANVWEPGVSGWSNISDTVPAWIQPTGAHDSYAEGAVVSHGGKQWQSTVAANVWEPGVSGWRATAHVLADGTEQPPAWVQPTGAHDAYQIGERVTHNGQVWENTVANNVWEPGVYGWVLV